MISIPAGWRAAYEFGCESKVCAPPPVGRGGSVKGKTVRTEMYRSTEYAMTLCPKCYKRSPDPTFHPIKSNDPSLKGGVEVCSDCGKTLRRSPDHDQI